MEQKQLTYAKINIKNLIKNHDTAKKLVGNGVKIMSVVKANGYGHGAAVVSKALEKAGTDFFGVANLDEALHLKKDADIKKDTFIFSGGDKHTFEEIVKQRFIPVIFDMINLRRLDKIAAKMKKTARVHLKFDTSMGRLGFFPQDAENVLKEAKRLGNIKVEGIMSHLSSADGAPFNKADRQIGMNPPYKHIANSAGIINLKESHYNLVRPGIMLYGSTPSKMMEKKTDLKPVMSIFSTIIQIKEFPKGSSISYSRTFTTKKKSKIAVLPIGYGDGLNRLLSNKGHVIIRGKKAPIVGNITMDLTMIDVTGVPAAKVGDTAAILGLGISAWDIAQLTGTISYEIFTSISKRVKRLV